MPSALVLERDMVTPIVVLDYLLSYRREINIFRTKSFRATTQFEHEFSARWKSHRPSSFLCFVLQMHT